MKNIKKYLFYFCFICLCFFVVNKLVLADTLYNNDSIQFYDNSGSSVSAVTTTYTSQIQESQAVFSTTADSYGGLAVLQLSTPLIQNHIYSLYFNIHVGNNGGKSKLSSKNCIGIGNSSTGATNSYINCAITPKFSDYSGRLIEKQNGVYYTFIATSNSIFLAVPYTSEYTCYNCPNYSYGFTINDGGDTTGLTQSQVNNLINQQTTIIQNEINNMQQDISDSLDENTDKQINSQKVCKIIQKNGAWKKGYLGSGGQFYSQDDVPSQQNYASPFIAIDENAEIKVIDNSDIASRTCFYDKNNSKISCIEGNTMVVGSLLTIPTNAYYFRTTYNLSTNKPKLQLCQNGNQALSGSIDDLNDSLTDSSPIDMSSIGNTTGWLPAGPIDSILNLPLAFLNSFSTALAGTCQPLSITLPYVNSNVSIPCLATIFSHINGLTTFWNWVGRIASIYILYKYLIALWEYYDRLTTMQVNFRDDFGGNI